MSLPADLVATTPHRRSSWGAELAARMRLYFVFKTIGITAFIWVFFIGYFWVLRHPAYPVTLMPLTALDRAVPFQPTMLWPYLTLWIYVGIVAALAPSFRHLIVHGAWATALCVTGLALFYFWPTAVPPRAFDASIYPGFALLQGVDAPGNACPSMHVAVAVFTAIGLHHLLHGIGAPRWLQLLNAAWCLAIVYSTLATKQHVALDAVAGALLGTTFAIFSLYWRPGGWWADSVGTSAADIIRRQSF